MKTVLSIEAIGDNVYADMRHWKRLLHKHCGDHADNIIGKIGAACWVAKILGFDDRYTWKREFIRGHRDYTNSNSSGSRGVYVKYILDSRYIYEVLHPRTWKRVDRYFAIVNYEGDIEQIPEEVVQRYLRSGNYRIQKTRDMSVMRHDRQRREHLCDMVRDLGIDI